MCFNRSFRNIRHPIDVRFFITFFLPMWNLIYILINLLLQWRLSCKYIPCQSNSITMSWAVLTYYLMDLGSHLDEKLITTATKNNWFWRTCETSPLNMDVIWKLMVFTLLKTWKKCVQPNELHIKQAKVATFYPIF